MDYGFLWTSETAAYVARALKELSQAYYKQSNTATEC